MKQNKRKVEEIDRNVIAIISKMGLTEKELFGLECYLAGKRAAGGAAEGQTGNRQQVVSGVSV